jgi:hypothetical protein
MKKNGVTEDQIQWEILELMKDRKIWTNGDLKGRLAKILILSTQDQAVGERKAEELWMNRVNNALGQSDKRSNSLYAKGFVEWVGHGQHRITDIGYRAATGTVTAEDLMKLAGL